MDRVEEEPTGEGNATHKEQIIQRRKKKYVNLAIFINEKENFEILFKDQRKDK